MSLQTSSYISCGCYFADLNWLQSRTQINQLKPDNHTPLFDKVHEFLASDTVLGQCCFQEMADAVLKAHTSASADNNAMNWQNYLDTTWAQLLKEYNADGTKNWVNVHFKGVYSQAFVYFYDVHGFSTATIAEDGRVKHHRPIGEGGKENVSIFRAHYLSELQVSQTMNKHLQNLRQHIAYFNLPFYNQRQSGGGRLRI